MNELKGYRIEFHILQSFPVTCLNRDDVGAPKSAMVGGVTRARVSSQCWKRQVRMELQKLGVKTALRTKQVEDVLTAACLKAGADDAKAREFAAAFARVLVDDTLLFFSESEARAIAEFALEHDFSIEAAIKKNSLTAEFKKIHKKYFNPAEDGLDIALFGRNSTCPRRPASPTPSPRTGPTAKWNSSPRSTTIPWASSRRVPRTWAVWNSIPPPTTAT